MCRCCQSCFEDIYWNCFEEKFCYDESIANYNPEDDDFYIPQKNGTLTRIQQTDNNNLPICNQPSVLSGKIHEDDYRRETQINVPMLGPEILAVFANSQIFQDHQPTKLNRINTRTYLPGIHSGKESSSRRESDQDKLIKRLEENLDEVANATNLQQPTESLEKRITFTITASSSPEDSNSLASKLSLDKSPPEKQDPLKDETDGVILRPRLIDSRLGPRHHISPPHKLLRNVQSVPHMKVRPAASETDIFAITEAISRISMTPEVPSISFSNLPKNYEDTPTIEKYKVSQSLYLLQTANETKASQQDYSMPRYFRRSAYITQSTENVVMPSISSESIILKKHDKEKSKRLKMLRETLPPLLIPATRKKDEIKQQD